MSELKAQHHWFLKIVVIEHLTLVQYFATLLVCLLLERVEKQKMAKLGMFK